MPLSSPQNAQLQKIRRAVESGRPLEDGTIAAEGPNLLAEALASRWRVQHVFFSKAALERDHALVSQVSRGGIAMTEVEERAFKTVSDTQHNQGVLALLKPRVFTWPELLAGTGPLVILDAIQDPGNAGTIIRSAEAFGGAGVVLTEGCVHISNGKLLRAAAGSLFRLPFLANLPISEILRQTAACKRSIFSLTAKGRVFLTETDLRSAFALVIGSESRGVSEAFIKASQTLRIATQGVESLNAAIACSLALFEAQRQQGRE